MYHLRRLTYITIVFLVISFCAWLLPRVLNPVPPSRERRREDNIWVSTSPYWIDRQACRWLSLCGIHHLRRDPPARSGFPGFPDDDDEGDELRLELRSLLSDQERSQAWQSAPEYQRRSRAKRTDKADDSPPRIPQYVLDYAPLVHLSSSEYFWPADIAEHVRHLSPDISEFEDLLNLTEPLSLHSLHTLNNYSNAVYLTSDDDVEGRPRWLYSDIGIPTPFEGGDDDEDRPEDRPQRLRDEEKWTSPATTWFDADPRRPLQRIADPRILPFMKVDLDSYPDGPPVPNIAVPGMPIPEPPPYSYNRVPGEEGKESPKQPRPDPSRQSPQQHYMGFKPDSSGYSKAPAVLVLVDKGSGILDAFWFFFYSYNLGQTVLGIRFGNHVGDWEHCMVRFENGIPRGIFFSEHEGGQAYAWPAVEKKGKRPVIYSAVGSHAMFAMPGKHPYVLPFGMLRDVADRGPLWDPAKNWYAYYYDYENASQADESEDGGGEENLAGLTPTAENPDAPTSWFHFDGFWGDRLYSLADMRQWRLFYQYHYVGGPQGPKFKRLGRRKLCQNTACTILHSVEPGRTWYG